MLFCTKIIEYFLLFIYCFEVPVQMLYVLLELYICLTKLVVSYYLYFLSKEKKMFMHVKTAHHNFNFNFKYSFFFKFQLFLMTIIYCFVSLQSLLLCSNLSFKIVQN